MTTYLFKCKRLDEQHREHDTEFIHVLMYRIKDGNRTHMGEFWANEEDVITLQNHPSFIIEFE